MTQKRYNLSEIATAYFNGDETAAANAIKRLQLEMAFLDAGKTMSVGESGGVQINVSSCRFLQTEHDEGDRYLGICTHPNTFNAFNKDGRRLCGPFFGSHPSSVCKESES